jgi:hypothetical protein
VKKCSCIFHIRHFHVAWQHREQLPESSAMDGKPKNFHGALIPAIHAGMTAISGCYFG